MSPLSSRVIAVLALLAPGPALSEARRPPATNVIQGIDVSDLGDGVELVVRGSRAPSYTVFKLQEPPRLVVDLAGADVSGVATPVVVARGGVREVTTAQYADERSAVGRVVVALEGSPRYEVTGRGDALVLRIGPAVATARHDAPAEARPTPAAAVPAERDAGQDAAPAAPAGEQPEGNVLSRRMDEAEVSQPATAVTGARARAGGVLVGLDGEVARFEVIELTGPPRIALDLYGVRRAPRSAVPLDGVFRQARFGRDEGKVRVVLDGAGELPRCEARRVKGGIAVAPAVVAERAPPAPRPRSGPRGDAPGRTVIDELRFSQAGGTARVELQGRPEHAVARTDARTLVLTLRNARLARKLERSIDASGFQGPVAMLSSFNQSGGDARVVVTLRADATDAVTETASGLAWTISSRGDAADGETADAPRAVTAEAQVAAAQAQPPAAAVSSTGQRREYSGRRITLDFHDIDIRNLLRLIADVSKKNIVVADDVTGKVTVSLRNVPWDQALDLVLRSKGLDKEEMGNVIRIAKIEAIAKEQQARLEAAKARLPLIPLKVRLLPVNFARAGDVATRVKDVLSERGTVSTDERTNVLIVKDVPEALSRAEGLVRNLDTETPQVRIESRIVEASSNYNRAIGVQWGGNATMSPGTGNPTGVFFPNIINASGAAGGMPTVGTTQPAIPGYAVNLPAPIGQGQGGGVGFTFGAAGGAFNLNLVLSALENNGVVKTISAPSVSTIDNKEATIGQGISIPFSQTSASGVNTVFVEAKLELKVTPHVTADGTVLMKIKVTNNQPNPQLTGANGQPSISKREAETEALVKDGETTVIGGIYTRQTSSNVAEVPFLGRIPILGFFFRNTAERDDHTELLVFITPRIINRQTTAAAVPVEPGARP